MSVVTNLKRRLFLQRSLMLPALSLLPVPFSRAATVPDDMLLGGGRFMGSDGQVHFVLSVVKPHINQVSTITTDFFPHGFAFSPQRKTLVYAFEKIGNGAALLDLDAGVVVKTIAPVKQRQFYGHGACTADNRYLFSTETSPDGAGAIGVRDPVTLDYLGDFPTYGLNPHECRLVDNDRVLMVTNGGGSSDSGKAGALCYIDVATRKLLKRADMPDARFNTGHFYPLAERKAVVVSAPRLGLDKSHLGAVSVFTGGDDLLPMTEPASVTGMMYGEALSVEIIPERDLFVVTHPTPGMLTLWSISQLNYRGHLLVSNARGVALSADRQCVWVSCGDQANIQGLNLATLKMEEQVSVAASYITGSHIINMAMV